MADELPRITSWRLTQIETFVNDLLDGKLPPAANTSALLAASLAMAREIRKCWEERDRPRDLTEAQARLLFKAEHELITLDYHGKDVKQQALRELVMSLLNWTTWPEK